jgi:S-adenosylmethionine decarboxylase
VLVNGGIEWIVDAFGCRAAALTDRRTITALLDQVVERAELHVVSTAEHVFAGPGGVTAMYLLAESHLTIHTFPESGIATLNLYCCRPRPVQDWQSLLTNALGAERVTVREVLRGRAGAAREEADIHDASHDAGRAAREAASGVASETAGAGVEGASLDRPDVIDLASRRR